MSQLPEPRYKHDASDPQWLAYAAQFHGHLGPWATAGLRAGMAARRAVKADGYFDVELTVEGPFVRPPGSCFLDGLQVSTGATLGKRNLKWIKADKIVVRLKNTGTGKVAEVRPTTTLLELLASLKPRSKTGQAGEIPNNDDHHGKAHSLEDLARHIARMAEKEIFEVTAHR